LPNSGSHAFEFQHWPLIDKDPINRTFVRELQRAFIFVGSPNTTYAQHSLAVAGQHEIVFRHFLHKIEDFSRFSSRHARGLTVLILIDKEISNLRLYVFFAKEWR